MGQRVNNKDIESIREIPYIQQQILSMERQCQWERSRARNTTQVFSAVPGGGDSARALEKAAAAMEEIAAEHAATLQRYVREQRRAERIVNGIRSAQMRTMVTMLYRDGLPPSAVQAVLRMSRYAFDAARTQIENAPDMASVKWIDRE